MGTFPNEAPLFSFGVIADVQYADRDDALNYPRTVVRHYRNARTLTRHAYEHWSSLPPRDSLMWHSASNWPRPEFVLQLGDLIDGWNSRQTRTKSSQSDANRSSESVSERAVSSLASHFSTLPAPTFHVWGNHELYCFTRSQLLSHPVLGSSVRSLGFPSVQNATEYSTLQKLGFLSSTSTADAAFEKSVDLHSDSDSRSETEPVSESEAESQDPERFSPTPNVFPGYYSFTYSPSASTSSLSNSPNPNPKPTSTREQSRSGGEGLPVAGVRWRFVALDTYEVFAHGYAPHEAPYREAQSTLALRNPNADKNSPTGTRPFEVYSFPHSIEHYWSLSF